MRTCAALLIAALAAAPAEAQTRSALATNPIPPSRAALDRLNLLMGWRTYLPIAGMRDGLATVQFLGDLTIVQTRSGLLAALDPRTGALRWQVRLGTAYPPVPLPVGANSHLIFAVNGTRLYEIDRVTGGIQAAFDLPAGPVAGPVADEMFLFICSGTNLVYCYLIDPTAGLATTRPGEVHRPAAAPSKPSAATLARVTPAAKPGSALPPRQIRVNPDGTLTEEPGEQDEMPTPAITTFEGVRHEPVPPSSGGLRQTAPSITVLPSVVPPYSLQNGGSSPSITVCPSVVPPYSLKNGGATPSIAAVRSIYSLNPVYHVGPQPKLLWELPLLNAMTQPPLQTNTMLFVPTASNEVMVVYKETRKFAYRFVPTAAISGPVAQFESTAYIPTGDGAVFAVDMETGRLIWRYAARGPVTRPMIVTRQDVYLTTSSGGLERIDRATGLLSWRNPQAMSLVAANPKFVYAKDRTGVLLVLGRARGRVLASLDLRDLVVPIADTRTDRLLLAAHNGLVISMHDREYVRPVVLHPEMTYKLPLPAKKPAVETPPPVLTPAPTKPVDTAPPTPMPKPMGQPAAPKPGEKKPGAAKPPEGAKPGDKKPGG